MASDLLDFAYCRDLLARAQALASAAIECQRRGDGQGASALIADALALRRHTLEVRAGIAERVGTRGHE